MVELVTINALQKAVEQLRAAGRLERAFLEQLEQLLAVAAEISPWADWSSWAKEKGFDRITGSGPCTKVVRTLAFALSTLAQAERPWPADLRLCRFAISSARSGCSDFRGTVCLEAESQGGVLPVFSGPFVWDCAAWGIDQTHAAQQRGYACMVEFPDFAVASTKPS